MDKLVRRNIAVIVTARGFVSREEEGARDGGDIHVSAGDVQGCGPADAVLQEIRQGVGPEGDVGSPDRLFLKVGQNGVDALILWVVEGAGIDGAGGPGLLVGVGRDGLLAAAQLLALLGVGLLLPLVVLHVAVQPDGHRLDAEDRIPQLVLRFRAAHSVDDLALQRRVHLADVRHILGQHLRLANGPRGLEGPLLVPPEQHRSHRDEDKARNNALERVAQALAPSRRLCFRVRHVQYASQVFEELKTFKQSLCYHIDRE